MTLHPCAIPLPIFEKIYFLIKDFSAKRWNDTKRILEIREESLDHFFYEILRIPDAATFYLYNVDNLFIIIFWTGFQNTRPLICT